MGYLQPETADASAVSPKNNWSKAVIAAKGGAAGTGLWLLDTLLGINSTNATNAANRAMTRETNALNYKMFQEQNQFNWDMWRATNKYNSPAYQRKLLEEAGYNAALYGGQGSDASNISAGAGHPAQVGNPMQNPYPPGIGTKMLSDSFQSMSALADARYKDAQAAGQNIDNVYKGTKAELELLNSGMDYQAKEIDNEIKRDSAPDLKEAQYLNNWKTAQETLKLEAETETEALLQDYHKMKTKEAEQAVTLMIQEGKELEAKALMEKSLGDKAEAEAAYQRTYAALLPSLVKSQIAKNNAEAFAAGKQGEFYSKQAAWQEIENGIHKLFGKGQAGATLLKSIADGNVSFKTARLIATQAQREGIHLKYDNILDMMRSFGAIIHTGSEAMDAVTPSPTGIKK